MQIFEIIKFKVIFIGKYHYPYNPIWDWSLNSYIRTKMSDITLISLKFTKIQLALPKSKVYFKSSFLYFYCFTPHISQIFSKSKQISSVPMDST